MTWGTWDGPLVIQPDVVTGTITASSDSVGDVGGTYTIHAKVDQDGTPYECDTGTAQWAGLLQ